MNADTKQPTLTQIEAVWPVMVRGQGALVCTKVGGRMLTRRFSTPLGLATYIDTVSGPGVDMYIHTNPTMPFLERKARSADIIGWDALLIDIDPTGKNPDVLGAQMRVYQTLEAMNYGHRVLGVDSGRGSQFWLLFSGINFITQNVLTRRRAEAAAANFLRTLGAISDVRTFGCAIDPCTSDLSRLARLPASVNSKTGKAAKAWLLPRGAWRESCRLSVADFFAQWGLPDQPAPEPMAAPPDNNWELRKVLAHISGKAAQFLTSGWVSPGRRGAVFAAAASLAEAGISESVAWDWVVRANDWCEPEPLMPSQLESPFNNGWKRGLENRATAGDH